MNNSGPSIEPWGMPNDTYCSGNRSIVAWNISFIGLRPVIACDRCTEGHRFNSCR